MGRPKLPDDERLVPLDFGVKPAEIARLDAVGEALEMRRADLCRHIVKAGLGLIESRLKRKAERNKKG